MLFMMTVAACLLGSSQPPRREGYGADTVTHVLIHE